MGEGSADTVAAGSASSAGAACAAAWARRARRSMEESRPPVRSASTGASAARARTSAEDRPSSCSAISWVDQVRTPAASTAATIGSLPPIRPVPRTQPMRGCAIETRWPHTGSDAQRVAMASKEAFASA